MKYTIPKHTPNHISDQYGFTLIELMISLVLGLLISAAVMQVFLTSQRVDRMQTAGSEIQDKAVFGLQSIEPQIRLANLGNDGVPINDKTNKGGIILTAGKVDATDVNVAVTDGDKAAPYLTLSGTSNVGAFLSNTDVFSDQLTIQYINTTGRELFDCEGEDIKLKDHVITRYFIKKTGSNLNLNCDAGRIEDKKHKDFTDNGVTIIENIDQFNIRLGVQQPATVAGEATYEYADMTVKEYMDLVGIKPNVVNIRVAILARSTANSPEASADKFLIFGKEQKLKTDSNAPKYLRRVYETNIVLRNARIMRIIESSTTDTSTTP